MKLVRNFYYTYFIPWKGNGVVNLFNEKQYYTYFTSALVKYRYSKEITKHNKLSSTNYYENIFGHNFDKKHHHIYLFD